MVLIVASCAVFVVCLLFLMSTTPTRLQKKRADRAERELAKLTEDTTQSQHAAHYAAIERYDESLEQAGQKIETAAMLVEQLRRLTDAARPEELKGALDVAVPLLRAVLPDKSGTPPVGMRIQTSWNKVFQLFNVPMRVAPKIELDGIPDGCHAELTNVTPDGFEVSFWWDGPVDPARPLPDFDFKAFVRL